MAEIEVLKKSEVQSAIDAFNLAKSDLADALTNLESSDQQVQSAIIEALTQTDVNANYISYVSGVKPSTAGASEGTIGAYFTNSGLFQKLQLVSGSWVDVGYGALTRKGLKTVFVSWFTEGTDDERIQSAIDEAGIGGEIIFDNEEYIIEDTIDLKKAQILRLGNAVIKRAAETTATTTSTVTDADNQVVVDAVPSNWGVGDDIHVYVNDGIEETSQKRTITDITGLTITVNGNFSPPTTAVSGTTSFPIGSTVRKVFAMFSAERSPDPEHLYISGGIFDGNRDNNTGNYYWNFNSCLRNFGFGGVIVGSRFINMPNENIFGSGTTVIGCSGEGLNGSFYHISSNTPVIDIQGTTIIGNIIRGVCEIPLSKNNHNEAPITHSDNPGKLTVQGNQFYGNGNNFAMELLRVNGADNSNWNKVFYQNNYHENFSSIIPTPSDLFVADERVATGNTFKDCGVNDFTAVRVMHPGVVFENNYYYGTTEVVGFEITPRKENELGAALLHESYNARLAGESVTNYAKPEHFTGLEDGFSIATFLMIPAAYKLNKIYPQIPADNSKHLPYTRSTAGNVQIYNGTAYENVAANIPLIDFENGYPELLLEGDKANRFVNPLTPATQTITVTVGKDYTVTVWGSGTVTLSDSIAQVVSEGESYTFEATTTSLVCTIAGSLDFVQVEQGITATSRIVSASSTILTRLRSVVDLTGLISAGFTNSGNKYSILFDFNPDYPGRTSAMVIHLYNLATDTNFQIKPQSSSSLNLSIEEPGEPLMFNNISANGRLLMVVDEDELTIYTKTDVTTYTLTGANNLDRIYFSPVGDVDFSAQMRLRDFRIYPRAIDRNLAETLVN